MLAHDRLGNGPQLVLLHPLGADRRVWEPVLGLLAPSREVIAIDLPGFGDSPPLPASPTPRALAEAVAQTLATIGVDGAHVAGNSLGGWVALELALAGHAVATTAIAPAGLWPQPLVPKPLIARRLARAGLPLIGALARTEAGRRALLRGVVAHPGNVPPRAAAHLVRAYATAPGFVAVNRCMRAGRFRDLARIPVPVCLAWPEYDGLVRVPASLPPNVVSRTLPRCGHIPMWDDPDAVAALLLRPEAQPGAELSQLGSSLR